MTDRLDSFLNSEPAPEPVADAAPAEGAAPATEKPVEADDEPQAQPAEGDTRTVPLAALEGERAARKDWKEKAVRSEGEITELRRQLEDARRPPPAPPAPPQYQQPINPMEDPEGFVQRMQEVTISNKLDVSEMMLRNAIGGEAVDAVIAEFKVAAGTNPSLFGQLYQQPHPYEWAHKQVEAMRLQRDIGTDPAAYKAKMRAEWEAEMANPVAPQQPRAAMPNMAPSLARTASAAPRSAPAFSGPPAMEDILGRR